MSTKDTKHHGHHDKEEHKHKTVHHAHKEKEHEEKPHKVKAPVEEVHAEETPKAPQIEVANLEVTEADFVDLGILEEKDKANFARNFNHIIQRKLKAGPKVYQVRPGKWLTAPTGKHDGQVSVIGYVVVTEVK